MFVSYIYFFDFKWYLKRVFGVFVAQNENIMHRSKKQKKKIVSEKDEYVNLLRVMGARNTRTHECISAYDAFVYISATSNNWLLCYQSHSNFPFSLCLSITPVFSLLRLFLLHFLLPFFSFLLFFYESMNAIRSMFPYILSKCYASLLLLLFLFMFYFIPSIDDK